MPSSCSGSLISQTGGLGLHSGIANTHTHTAEHASAHQLAHAVRMEMATHALKSTSPDVCRKVTLTRRMELSGLCLCSL